MHSRAIRESISRAMRMRLLSDGFEAHFMADMRRAVFL